MSNERRNHLLRFGAKILLALGLSTQEGCTTQTTTQAVEDASDTQASEPARRNFMCPASEPIFFRGQPTGFERCIETPEVIHRREIMACPAPPIFPRHAECPGYDRLDAWACRKDTDCPDPPYQPAEYCSHEFCMCIPIPYSCRTDEDCPEDKICVCGDESNTCQYAECRSDADCPFPFLCMRESPSICGSTFHCQRPDDECFVDSDCKNPNPERYVVACAPRSNGEADRPAQCYVHDCRSGINEGGPAMCFSCVTPGRPFLVEGEARLAPQESRADWVVLEVQPSLTSLSDARRAALCAHWTQIGLMEHASIAAFARSVMQLMSASAPQPLVEATIDAMRDETKHARWAFSLASAYAGAPIGPGPLSMACALPDTDFTTMLITTIDEGCIGETVAALEALEERDQATDPVVRAVLSAVADDETRHATLAWRTIQWALSLPDAPREAIRAAFHKVLSLADAPTTSLRDAVLHDLVGPCARKLLLSHSPGEPSQISGAKLIRDGGVRDCKLRF